MDGQINVPVSRIEKMLKKAEILFKCKEDMKTIKRGRQSYEAIMPSIHAYCYLYYSAPGAPYEDILTRAVEIDGNYTDSFIHYLLNTVFHRKHINFLKNILLRDGDLQYYCQNLPEYIRVYRFPSEINFIDDKYVLELFKDKKSKKYQIDLVQRKKKSR